MKHILLFAMAFLAIAFTSDSASAQCTPDGSQTTPGIGPSNDNIDCLVKDEAWDQTLQFMNFDSVSVGPQTLKVNWIVFKKITNLPFSDCETTTVVTDKDTFFNQDPGCIQLSGMTTANAGQYKLEFIIDANVTGANGQPTTVRDQSTSALGDEIAVILRVKADAADACPNVDDATEDDHCETVSIEAIEDKISELDIVPNPIRSKGTLSFFAAQAERYTLSVFNVIGQEVDRFEIDANYGNNNVEIDASEFESGIYIYKIADANNQLTKRFMVKK